MIKLTLGTDSAARKDIQLVAACLRYIPAALAQFALHSKAGNDKHNPGQPIHHARGKSMDHEECILRHLVDLQDIRAYIEREGLAFDVHVNPEHERAVAMLIEEATAEFWRAGIFLQELCETYLDAPLAPGAVAAVPEGTVDEEIDYPEETFDDSPFNFATPFAAPSDPAKLPQIVDGSPWREPWVIVDGNGNYLSAHQSHADAEECLRVMFAPQPVNTPEELAELVKMQGKIVLVGGPGLVDGGHVEHGFPLFPECPSERGNGVDEAGLYCGAVSSTNRVCTRMSGHAGAHADAGAQWAGIE
jgi:hypothetical protein